MTVLMICSITRGLSFILSRRTQPHVRIDFYCAFVSFVSTSQNDELHTVDDVIVYSVIQDDMTSIVGCQHATRDSGRRRRHRAPRGAAGAGGRGAGQLDPQ